MRSVHSPGAEHTLTAHKGQHHREWSCALAHSSQVCCSSNNSLTAGELAEELRVTICPLGLTNTDDLTDCETLATTKKQNKLCPTYPKTQKYYYSLFKDMETEAQSKKKAAHITEPAGRKASLWARQSAEHKACDAMIQPPRGTDPTLVILPNPFTDTVHVTPTLSDFILRLTGRPYFYVYHQGRMTFFLSDNSLQTYSLQVPTHSHTRHGSSSVTKAQAFSNQDAGVRVLAQLWVGGREIIVCTGHKHFPRREMWKDRSLQLKFALSM